MVARYLMLLTSLWLGAISCADAAEPYPNRPVHILVPFAAGGGTDLITRALADVIAETRKTSIVIDNRPGGGTSIATQAALTAPPDGYALLAISNSFLSAPVLIQPAPYAWKRDFTAVSIFAVSPHVLVVHPSVPATTLAEFTAWARAQNGGATYASFGNGASNHLNFELLKRKLGVAITHIPYKGSAPALNDLVAGHVKAMLGDLQNVSQQVKAGTLRAIAVANEKRLPSMPDIPTIAEQGVDQFTSKSIFGAVARTGTPPDIIAKWSSAFAEALERPSVRQRLDGLGLELVGMTPVAAQSYLELESTRTEEAVRVSGAKAE